MNAGKCAASEDKTVGENYCIHESEIKFQKINKQIKANAFLNENRIKNLKKSAWRAMLTKKH